MSTAISLPPASSVTTGTERAPGCSPMSRGRSRHLHDAGDAVPAAGALREVDGRLFENETEEGRDELNSRCKRTASKPAARSSRVTSRRDPRTARSHASSSLAQIRSRCAQPSPLSDTSSFPSAPGSASAICPRTRRTTGSSRTGEGTFVSSARCSVFRSAPCWRSVASRWDGERFRVL